MAGALFDLLAVLLVLTILRARPAVVLAILGASLLLVPGPFVVPHSPTSLLTFPHLITLATAARLLIGRLDRTMRSEHLRVTPLQLVLLVLLLVVAVVGIVLSPAAGPLGFAPGRLLDVVDDLVFLTAALALTRQTSPGTTIRAMALGLGLGIAVTLLEHVSGRSYGHTIFSAVNDVHQSAAFPLSVREGSTRVRAGTEFALQYAWIAAMLAPALLVTAWRRGGVLVAAAAAGLTLLSVYWSYSRTALAATALLLLVTGAVLARRAWPWVIGPAVAVTGAALLLSQSLQDHLNPNTDIGSVHERTRRLSAVMDVVSHHPFRGIGLGELGLSGFGTTDFAFLIAYVETGVIGLVAVSACLAFALRSVAPALATSDARRRDEGLVAVAAVTAFVASTFTYDAFTLIQGTHALWLAAAAGVVLVERRTAAPVPLRWSNRVVGRAAAASGLGLLLGLMIYQVAPTHTAQQSFFTTIDQGKETRVGYDPLTPAQRFVNTVCTLATETAARHVKVSCADSFGAAGVGRIRLQADNPFALQEAVTHLDTTIRVIARIDTFRHLPTELPRTGRDSWARTAPVWMALSAFAVALLLSPRRGRRDEPELPPGESGDAAGAPAPDAPAPAAAARR
jgi:hypothetical protein